MPPSRILAEYPERLGLRVTMVQIAIYADLSPRLTELGLTSPNRMTALLHVQANPGCSQSELAEFTGLSRASAMTMVDQLEKAGLVDRRPGPDARTNALYLTDAGRLAAQRAVEQTSINEDLVFAALSNDEHAQLGQLLEKVIAHLDTERGRSTSQ